MPSLRLMLLCLLVSLPLAAAPAPQSADLILHNGAVYTVDSARSWAQALAIREGRLLYVGDDRQALGLKGPQTRVIDLDGKMVLPGFHDAHVHPASGGLELLACDLNNTESAQQVFETIAAYAKSHPDDKWIVGGGWSLPDFPKGQPNRQQLDRLVPDRPAFFTSTDAHTAWVNSKALEMAGIDRSTPAPAGGEIVHDEQGEPSGLLREEAIALVSKLLPPATPEQRLEGLRTGLNLAAQFGITSLVEANADEDILESYAELARTGELSARVVASLSTKANGGAEQVGAMIRLRERFLNLPNLRPDAAKVFVDGVVEGGTAALLEPYLDTGGRGVLIHQEDKLEELLVALDAAGFQVHVHAIGDRGVRLTLDGLQKAREQNGYRDSRHQIAHLQMVDSADVPRFRQLGVVADFQALWAFRDRFITQLTEPVLGPERSSRLYPMGDLYRSGAVLAAGSDWSVTSMNPLLAIETGVRRQDPESQEGESWLPDQALSLEAMLAAYTAGGAYVMHHLDQTGTLEVGKWADLVVLDRNLFEIPATEISEAKVVLTLLAGEQIYPNQTP